MKVIIKAVLLHYFISSQVTGKCLNECDCIHTKGTLKLKCDGRNYSNLPLVYVLPQNIAVISFKNNKIQKLQKQPVGLRRRNVWRVDLSGNIIDQFFQDNLGEPYPNLSHLDLAKNKIASLSEHSFQHLRKLKVLFLSNNKLRKIKKGWFSYMLQLSHLDLGQNEITVIEETKGIWPKRLTTLHLSYNLLKTVPPLPGKAAQVNLENNPIFCNCHLNVNRKIMETFIKVNCRKLDYYRERVAEFDTEESGSELVKYRSSGQICKATEIINFSFLLAKKKVILTCITSYGCPEPSVTVSYRDREIRKSRNNVTMDIAESGMYTCKITNYISSDQRQLFIPDLSSVSTQAVVWTEPKLTTEQEEEVTAGYEVKPCDAVTGDKVCNKEDTTFHEENRQADNGHPFGKSVTVISFNRMLFCLYYKYKYFHVISYFLLIPCPSLLSPHPQNTSWFKSDRISLGLHLLFVWHIVFAATFVTLLQ